MIFTFSAKASYCDYFYTVIRVCRQKRIHIITRAVRVTRRQTTATMTMKMMMMMMIVLQCCNVAVVRTFTYQPAASGPLRLQCHSTEDEQFKLRLPTDTCLELHSDLCIVVDISHKLSIHRDCFTLLLSFSPSISILQFSY